MQRSWGGEGCRSRGEHATAGDRAPLLCLVFNPLTILFCLNRIRKATRELYCQAHHGNTSALQTYQLLGALAHCFLSSPRSSFPCCLHAPGCLAIPGGPPEHFSLRQLRRGPVKYTNWEPSQCLDCYLFSGTFHLFPSSMTCHMSIPMEQQHPTNAQAAARQQLLWELSSLPATREEGR